MTTFRQKTLETTKKYSILAILSKQSKAKNSNLDRVFTNKKLLSKQS